MKVNSTSLRGFHDARAILTYLLKCDLSKLKSDLFDSKFTWYIFEFDLIFSEFEFSELVKLAPLQFALTLCEPDLTIRKFELISWEFDLTLYAFN